MLDVTPVGIKLK